MSYTPKQQGGQSGQASSSNNQQQSQQTRAGLAGMTQQLQNLVAGQGALPQVATAAAASGFNFANIGLTPQQQQERIESFLKQQQLLFSNTQIQHLQQMQQNVAAAARHQQQQQQSNGSTSATLATNLATQQFQQFTQAFTQANPAANLLQQFQAYQYRLQQQQQQQHQQPPLQQTAQQQLLPGAQQSQQVTPQSTLSTATTLQAQEALQHIQNLQQQQKLLTNLAKTAQTPTAAATSSAGALKQSLVSSGQHATHSQQSPSNNNLPTKSPVKAATVPQNLPIKQPPANLSAAVPKSAATNIGHLPPTIKAGGASGPSYPPNRSFSSGPKFTSTSISLNKSAVLPPVTRNLPPPTIPFAKQFQHKNAQQQQAQPQSVSPGKNVENNQTDPKTGPTSSNQIPQVPKQNDTQPIAPAVPKSTATPAAVNAESSGTKIPTCPTSGQPTAAPPSAVVPSLETTSSSERSTLTSAKPADPNVSAVENPPLISSQSASLSDASKPSVHSSQSKTIKEIKSSEVPSVAAEELTKQTAVKVSEKIEKLKDETAKMADQNPQEGIIKNYPEISLSKTEQKIENEKKAEPKVLAPAEKPEAITNVIPVTTSIKSVISEKPSAKAKQLVRKNFSKQTSKANNQPAPTVTLNEDPKPIFLDKKKILPSRKQKKEETVETSTQSQEKAKETVDEEKPLISPETHQVAELPEQKLLKIEEIKEEKVVVIPVSESAKNVAVVSAVPEPTKTVEVGRGKRHRLKTIPYQSPLPELELISKLSVSEASNSPKANEDRLTLFYKNEYLAVRNADGGFFICQTIQNVYRRSPRIRIRWLSEEKSNSDVYIPDFYDTTDIECVLTTVVLQKVGKEKFKLPTKERERIESILKKALDVEKGVAPRPDVTEENPDGLDISIYKDESQIEKLSAQKRKLDESTASTSNFTISRRSKGKAKSPKKKKKTKSKKSTANGSNADENDDETDDDDDEIDNDKEYRPTQKSSRLIITQPKLRAQRSPLAKARAASPIATINRSKSSSSRSRKVSVPPKTPETSTDSSCVTPVSRTDRAKRRAAGDSLIETVPTKKPATEQITSKILTGRKFIAARGACATAENKSQEDSSSESSPIEKSLMKTPVQTSKSPIGKKTEKAEQSIGGSTTPSTPGSAAPSTSSNSSNANRMTRNRK